MEVTDASEQVKLEAQRFEDVARYNIRRYMRLTGKLQKDLAQALGVSRPTVTLMLKGETKLNLRQAFLIAKALGVTVEDLIDDTYYCQDEEFMKKMKSTTTPTSGALVGAGSPRFLVSPFNPDAPLEGGISGAAKGALANFVPSVVSSGSGSPSRSQAHETLGAMTTIIMRTSDDNRGQLFLALFQGFQFLGNLPITLVFDEAPTGTQA